MKQTIAVVVSCLTLLVAGQSVNAQAVPPPREYVTGDETDYSPYVDRNIPTRVFCLWAAYAGPALAGGPAQRLPKVDVKCSIYGCYSMTDGLETPRKLCRFADFDPRQEIHYSPYVDRTRVFWGDTHHHTSNSPDAGLVGNTIGPDMAYRFARGEEVTSSSGLRVQLIRPLASSWCRTMPSTWVCPRCSQRETRRSPLIPMASDSTTWRSRTAEPSAPMRARERRSAARWTSRTPATRTPSATHC